MKAMLKRGGVFAALSAVLLLTAVLVTSCPDPYAKSSSSGYEPPAGMGYVQLKLVKNVGRTILPTEPNVSAFTWFKLTFTPSTGPAVEAWRESADIYDPIPLLPGAYDLDVIAYHDLSIVDPTSTPPIEEWATFSTTGTPIGIISGTGGSLSVLLTLTPPPGSETGTFAWIITDGTTDGFDSATMAISTITGTPVGSSVDLKATGTSSQTLTEGYYFVDLDLALPAPGSETIKIRQVLQVYRYLTSTYTETFTDGWFGLEEEDKEDFYIISPIEVDDIPNNPPEIIINTAATGLQFVTSLTTEAGLLIATLNGDGSTLPNRVSLTLDNDTDYDDIQWYSYNTTTLDYTLLGSAAIQLIAASATPFGDGLDPVPGIYYVTVIGWADGGIGSGTPYTSYIIIKVIP